jgi:inositol-phosphate phosphatase / L-galactose 1-phosphate phosphatase / histidinol-phosphatase
MITNADIAFAHRLADAAADIARRYFRAGVAVDDKDDASPVTIADREAERVMREIIAKERPQDGTIGEEFGKDRPDAARVWVLDPIDGTKAFISGNPVFGSLIGLAVDGLPALGVIECPALGERWIGANGHPTVFRDRTGTTRPARVRACADLSGAALYSQAPLSGHDTFAGFDRLRKAVKRPMHVCDCYAYGLLASGSVDLVVEAGLGIYDIVALVPVVENAGGTIADWRGNKVTLATDGRVIASGDARLQAPARAALLAG